MFLKVEGVNYVNHLGKYSKYPLLVKEVFFRMNNLHTVSIYTYSFYYNYFSPREYFISYVNLVALSWYTFNCLKLRCDIQTRTCIVNTILKQSIVIAICLHPVVRQQTIRDTKSSEDTLQSENLKTFVASSCLETSFFLG